MCVMTIPWIKCSERMPPDDGTKIILNNMKHTSIELGTHIHSLASIRMDISTLSWIPYDEAIWRELTR